MGLVIRSTYFPHPKIHKATWISHDQRIKNQIDHIAVDVKHASNVFDVRTFRGPNVDSDHFLVMAKIRSGISTSKLKRDRVSSANTMRDALKHLSKKFSESEHWELCSNVILDTAKKVLNVNPPRRRSPWFDEKCAEAICGKNEARRKKLQRETRAVDDHYRELRRVANRVIGRKKRNYKRAELHDLENLRNSNKIRKFYKKLEGQIQGFKASHTSINLVNLEP